MVLCHWLVEVGITNPNLKNHCTINPHFKNQKQMQRGRTTTAQLIHSADTRNRCSGGVSADQSSGVRLALQRGDILRSVIKFHAVERSPPPRRFTA